MSTIKLYTNLRKLAGMKELSIAGATIRALLNELARQKPALGSMILQNGEIAPHFILTLNGQNIIDLETPVTEQDVVAIFPPIAGG